MTKSVVAVNPFDCRMWDLHDRLQISEESCRQEIESFSRQGQLIPALGRPLVGDATHKIELIYGARRLFVARHLNLPLLVELRQISDRDASVAMDIENRQRSDISPYERGRSYARWLLKGHFSSQEDIAKCLGISASQVSRLLKLAQLPTIVVDAFDNPAAICEGWGIELMQLLEDPKRRQHIIRTARSLSVLSPRPLPREVHRRLVSLQGVRRSTKPEGRDEVVKDPGGRPLFRIRQQRRSIAIVLPLEKVSMHALRSLRTTISELLIAVENDRVLSGPRLGGATSELSGKMEQSSTSFSS